MLFYMTITEVFSYQVGGLEYIQFWFNPNVLVTEDMIIKNEKN